MSSLIMGKICLNLNPYPANVFVLKMSSVVMSAAYIQVHFRLDSIMESNIMNPDQTAPLGAVWSGSILFAI